MHTHFGSATMGAAAFLSVLIFGTFWRLSWMQVGQINNQHAKGLARAALAQF